MWKEAYSAFDSTPHFVAHEVHFVSCGPIWSGIDDKAVCGSFCRGTLNILDQKRLAEPMWPIT